MKNPLHLHIMIKMWAAVQDYKWPSISQIIFLFRDHTPQYRSPCTKKLNNTYNIFLQEGGLSSQNLPITHHVVCIRKKLGLCVDCRLLNQKTIPDRHPLPQISQKTYAQMEKTALGRSTPIL